MLNVTNVLKCKFHQFQGIFRFVAKISLTTVFQSITLFLKVFLKLQQNAPLQGRQANSNLSVGRKELSLWHSAPLCTQSMPISNSHTPSHSFLNILTADMKLGILGPDSINQESNLQLLQQFEYCFRTEHPCAQTVTTLRMQS